MTTTDFRRRRPLPLPLVSPSAHAWALVGFEAGPTFTLKVAKVPSTGKTGLAGPDEAASGRLIHAAEP